MRTRLVDAQRQAHAKAHVRLCRLHEGPRSIARMAALEAFAADPPLTAKADARVHKLAAVAKREARRVRRAAKRANGSIESLHAVRKAGRRLRYLAEALHAAVPDEFGADFEELAEAGEDVHDALGDHRDELIFIERLELARAQAGRAGERVEQYDALIARAAERADESLAGLDAALDRVRAAAAAI
jgi:CHAD domain-containing protein